MTDPLPWLILLPLAWGVATFLLGPGRGVWLAVAGLTLQLMLAVQLAREVARDGAYLHAAGGWPVPLGIELTADGLAAAMLLLTQCVALPIALYARAWFAANPAGAHHFWPLTGFLLAALHALFLSADIFNLYVTLELLTLAAAGLVAAKGGAPAVVAALRYLLAALLGSGTYLFGVALLYGAYGTVSLSLLAQQIGPDAPDAVLAAGLLMLAGLLIKTALFPVHFWLPPAHGGAPAPVSALLSALVIKGTFYLAMRLWLALFMPLAPLGAQLLGWLGTIAIIWGSLMAWRQPRLKMLVAYSTVAQIGYLFLFFPLVTQTGAHAEQSALQGTVLQVVAHGLAKAAMFAAAGALALSTGGDEIARLGGAASRLPLTLFTFALAGVTLMGLPPSAGFIAKWLLIDSAIAAGQWGWIVVLVAGGLLTAAYVLKVVRHALLRARHGVVFTPVSPLLEWPPLLLALASLALGLHAGGLIALLDTS